MKPASEQKKAQTFFLEPREEIELNATYDPKVEAAFQCGEPVSPGAYTQNTTTHD